MNSPEARCPTCGCEITSDAPSGLCPHCLLKAAEHDPWSADQQNTPLQTDSAQPPFVAPELQALSSSFPQFELIELLGQGGMGAVYKARQKSLDRLVAIKIIHPVAAQESGFSQRFAREARALARLNHNHIVAIYDFGEFRLATTGSESPTFPMFYFVMEYVEGTTLRRLMDTRSVPPQQALAMITQICDALQFAHDEGIVHRDIKPENILVELRPKRGRSVDSNNELALPHQGAPPDIYSVRIKIADFGLAKLLGDESREAWTLTGTHQVMGTPRYMAPEQMEGSRTVDHRADIYSLGVVFYELLTGETPLGHFDPPSKKAAIDIRIDQVVLRSLAREPDRRYQHASDVKTDIDSIRQMAAVSPPFVQSQPEALVPSIPQQTSSSKPGAAANDHEIRYFLAFGLLLTLFALIVLGMVVAPSTWLLMSLSIPWFAIGVCYIYAEELSARERRQAVVLGVSFLISAGLIGWQVGLQKSGWPLIALPVIVLSFCLGAALGRGVKDINSPANAVAEKPAQEAQKKSQTKKEQKEAAALLEKVQTSAWFVGFVGAARTLDFLPTAPKLINALFHRGSETIADPATVLFQLTGPIILLGAVAMYHCRHFAWAIVASGLCLATSNFVPIIISISSLSTLYDRKVRALFGLEVGDDQSQLSNNPSTGRTLPAGKRFIQDWTIWWQGRDASIVAVVQLTLAVISGICLVAFLSFIREISPHVENDRWVSHRIGVPQPWFTLETKNGPTFSTSYQIHGNPLAWLVPMLGIACAYACWQLAKAREPFSDPWYRPGTIIVLWAVLACIDVGFCFYLHLRDESRRPVETPLSSALTRPVNSYFVRGKDSTGGPDNAILMTGQ